MMYPRPSASRILATANETTIRPGGHVGPLGCIDGVNHVGLGDIDELVRQTFEAVGQRDDLCLNVARLARPTGPNEVDDACHLGRELIVVLSDLAEEIRFFVGDKLHAVEVIAELSELTERSIEHPVVLKQERGRDAVELARRVVLNLMIGCDLALQLDQFIGLVIDPAQHLQPDRAEHDQQADNREKRDQKLGLNTRRPARDPANQPVPQLTWIRPRG